MAMPTVDTDVVQLLDDVLAWIITEATGQNCSAGPVRYNLVARPAVFVEAYGGTSLEHTDGTQYDLTLQVTLLGTRDAYGASRAKAVELWNALHRKGRWVGASGAVYYDMLCSGAGPIPTGQEDDESCRFDFSITVKHDG